MADAETRYQVGDYLVHENVGVCKVVEISEQALQGKGSEKLYYSLEPVFTRGSSIITPVDTKVRIRDVTPPEEFDRVLSEVNTYAVIEEPNSRVRAEIYKEELAKFEIVSLAALLKTVYLRKELRIAQSKKVMSSDEKVLTIASKKLFEEMAFSYDTGIEEEEQRFYDTLKPSLESFIEEHL